MSNTVQDPDEPGPEIGSGASPVPHAADATPGTLTAHEDGTEPRDAVGRGTGDETGHGADDHVRSAAGVDPDPAAGIAVDLPEPALAPAEISRDVADAASLDAAAAEVRAVAAQAEAASSLVGGPLPRNAPVARASHDATAPPGEVAHETQEQDVGGARKPSDAAVPDTAHVGAAKPLIPAEAAATVEASPGLDRGLGAGPDPGSDPDRGPGRHPSRAEHASGSTVAGAPRSSVGVLLLIVVAVVVLVGLLIWLLISLISLIGDLSLLGALEGRDALQDHLGPLIPVAANS